MVSLTANKFNTVGRADIPLLKYGVVTGSPVPVVKESCLPDESRHFFYIKFTKFIREPMSSDTVFQLK